MNHGLVTPVLNMNNSFHITKSGLGILHLKSENTTHFFSRPSPKAVRELQTELDRMMEDEDEDKDP